MHLCFDWQIALFDWQQKHEDVNVTNQSVSHQAEEIILFTSLGPHARTLKMS